MLRPIASIARVFLAVILVFLFLLEIPGSAQQALILVAAGSGLPEPLYRGLNSEFSHSNPRVSVRYLPMGTEEGLKQMKRGEADLGGGDFPWSGKDLESARGKVIQVPVAVVGIAVVCNVPGVAQELRLTGPVVADIFLGKITKWNQPDIAKLNPGVALPNTGILLLHRTEGKGANYVFTDYLSRVSTEFKSRIGKSLSPRWVSGTSLARGEDVLFQVKDTDGAIGYVELDLAEKAGVTMAHIQNADGFYVKPALSSLAAAAEHASPEEDFRGSIVNSGGKESYPIASFTWLYVPEREKSAERKGVVKSYVAWLLQAGQRLIPKLGFAPLPSAVAKRAVEKLATVQ